MLLLANDSTRQEETQIFINIESASKEEKHDIELEELEQLTHNLRDDLTELDSVEKIDLVTKEDREEKDPDGLKHKGDVVTLGSLLVTLGVTAASEPCSGS